MSGETENRRAAAICEQCGSCHVVRIKPDGTVRVIGTSGGCGCGADDYHILGSAGPEPDGPRDGPIVSGNSNEA
jgi:hypothetical protein